MKKVFVFILSLLLGFPCLAQKRVVIADDIRHFWNAYDQIVQTTDSLEQLRLIDQLYISKGSPGLKSIMEARRYTREGYVHAINQYPKFWHSIRNNTLKADEYAANIEKAIQKLRRLYPGLKPANIYFTIGVLRTGGTTLKNDVLIGSEVAMADHNTETQELDAQYAHLREYFASDPINSLDFLNVHEYIHTQQKTTIGNSLLAQCLIEGVAEYVAEKALEVKSPNPQIAYGKMNDAKLQSAFAREMFSSDFGLWLWGAEPDQFGMRDLGYYIGYAISEKYYNKSTDKIAAVREMIQLDYNNENALFKFVDDSGYFGRPIKSFRDEFENNRPKVVRIEPFENKSQNVNPSTKTITLHFSKPMNPHSRGFDFGPMGADFVLRVQKINGYSADRKSFSFDVNLAPGKHYQSVASERFKDENGYSLQPFLIDFKTSP
ncbi:hypothetical protein [Flavobacterium sp.]|uniref:hypothetical protein n=1 Tax=Flavobacterium sp. TaxID=239 RepID=UPI0039E5E0A6